LEFGICFLEFTITLVRNIYESTRTIPLRRPDELATDTSPAIDYVVHALEWMRNNKGQTFDIVSVIQPTSPLTSSEDIDATIQLLLDNDRADSAVSVMRLNQVTHPFKLKIVENNWLKSFLKEEKIILQAGELPDVYTRNGSVYVARMSSICSAYEQYRKGNYRRRKMPRPRHARRTLYRHQRTYRP